MSRVRSVDPVSTTTTSSTRSLTEPRHRPRFSSSLRTIMTSETRGLSHPFDGIACHCSHGRVRAGRLCPEKVTLPKPAATPQPFNYDLFRNLTPPRLRRPPLLRPASRPPFPNPGFPAISPEAVVPN